MLLSKATPLSSAARAVLRECIALLSVEGLFVHHYELIGDVTVHPGQPVRTADPSPRTVGQYQERNRGQADSHQLPRQELLIQETGKEESTTGPKDPWARFRHDPVAQKAARLAISKKK